jgi:hypothetical protein
MSRHRFAAAVLVAAGALATAGPAVAAPPANDDVADATVLTALPFRTVVDTTEATSEATDPFCEGPNSHSIWYRLTPSVSAEYAVTQFIFPDFPLDLGIGVYTGRPGALTEVACNNSRGANVRWEARAGTSYLIMVATGQGLGRGFADIPLTIQRVPPPIEVRFGVGDLRLDPASGGVFVPMTVRCSLPASFVQIQISISQWRRGRLVEGGTETMSTCPQGTHRRRAFVRPPAGERFGRWRAHLVMGVAGCDPFTCDGRSIDRRVLIR